MRRDPRLPKPTITGSETTGCGRPVRKTLTSFRFPSFPCYRSSLPLSLGQVRGESTIAKFGSANIKHIVVAILMIAPSFASGQSSDSVAARVPERLGQVPQADPAQQELEGSALLATAHERFARLTREDNDAAISLYERAVARTPSAPAYAGLAEAFAQRFYWNRGDRSALDAALEMATKALALDSRSAQAHFARAFATGRQ